LHQGFPAGDCHTAAGLIKENFVLQYLHQRVVDAHPPACELLSRYRTNISALTAPLAQPQVAEEPPVQMQGTVRTCADAIATLCAALLKMDCFRFALSTFGVMAPEAVEGTALQENSGANTRAVMGGEAHDVEDETRGPGGKVDCRGSVSSHGLGMVHY
jgi:hypothetical protein